MRKSYLVLILGFLFLPLVAYVQDEDNLGAFDGAREAGETIQVPPNAGSGEKEAEFAGKKAQAGVRVIGMGDFDDGGTLATMTKTVIPGLPDGLKGSRNPDESDLKDLEPASLTFDYRIQQYSRFLIRSLMKGAKSGNTASGTP